MNLTQQAHTKILHFNTAAYFAGYAEIKDVPPPVIFSFVIPDGKQTVDLVGTQHAHQMADQQQRNAMIAKLDRLMEEYVAKTMDKPNNRLIMIEGGGISGVTNIQDRIEKLMQALKASFQEQHVTTEQEAVEKFGEMGAVIYFAMKNNIPFMSPEPSTEEIIVKLKSEGIPDKTIALRQAILYLDEYAHRGKHRNQKRFTKEEAMSALTKACAQSGWPVEHETILPQFNKEMQNEVGLNLVNEDYSWAYDPNDHDTYNLIHSPSSPSELFKKISNITGEFRDHYILDHIVEAVNEEYSPFVVYGDGHVVKLKPALDYLYKENLRNQN